MTALELVARRWPHVIEWMNQSPRDPELRVDPHPAGNRLMAGTRTLVSPGRPEKEAERLVSRMASAGPDASILLVGHGLGHTLAALLGTGAARVLLAPVSAALLREALEHWACPAVLEDPRFDVLIPGMGDAELSPGMQVVELPSFRKAFPEQLARIRVALGRCAADELRLRVMVIEPIYGGSLPVARSCARALETAGHEVVGLSFEAMAEARAYFQDFVDRRPGAESLSQDFLHLLGRMIAVECHRVKPDLVLALAQSPATPVVMREIREAGIRTAFWFVEDYELLEYWKRIHGSFDMFLTIQRGEFHRRLAELSPAPVRYLPMCADTEFLVPTAWPGPGPAPELSFVGAGYHNRERAFLRLMDMPLRIWGSDWRPQSPLWPRVEQEGERTTAEQNREIFSASRINLNLHSSTYHEGVNPFGDFVNPRTFEIAACGGFQLVDQRSLLPELFQEGSELVCYSSVEELRDLVLDWSKRPEDRARIAAGGRRRTLAEHGYGQRMKELLELFLIEDEQAFPHARKRGTLQDFSEDPELKQWLLDHGLEESTDLDAAIDAVRRSGSSLDETASLLVYLGELRDWAREKGIERAYEQITR